jgi:hypothetical protein
MHKDSVHVDENSIVTILPFKKTRLHSL